MNFKDFFTTIEGWGLTDALLPFLLIFTVIFAILQKTKVIGEDKKNIHVVLALIIALLVVIPHLTNPGSKADVVPIINQAIPHVSLVVVAIVMLLILIGVFGRDIEFMSTSLAGWIALVSFILVVYIFGSAAGWKGFKSPTWSWWSPDIQAIVMVILVFGIIIWLITKEPRAKQEKASLGNLIKKIGESVKK